MLSEVCFQCVPSLSSVATKSHDPRVWQKPQKGRCQLPVGFNMCKTYGREMGDKGREKECRACQGQRSQPSAAGVKSWQKVPKAMKWMTQSMRHRCPGCSGWRGVCRQEKRGEVSRACKSWKLGLGEVLLHEVSIMVIIKGTDSVQQPESALGKFNKERRLA